MTGFLAGALATLAVLVLVALPRHLTSASWPTRVPATALLLWQAAFLTGWLAILGAGVFLGLRPLGADLPHALVDALHGRFALEVHSFGGQVNLAVLLVTVLVGLAAIGSLAVELRHRAEVRGRQRTLVDLVSAANADWPGVAVIDHPQPIAYSIPGWSWRIVLTRGLLDELEPRQISAVLAHERAHARQRHQWVTLLFAVAIRCRVPGARAAVEEVRGLLEMCADDAVRRQHEDRVLVSALLFLAQATAEATSPTGTFAAADRLSVDRVQRLLTPAPRARWLPPMGSLSAVCLLAAPILAIVLPCLTL